jgi:hypothetical protein
MNLTEIFFRKSLYDLNKEDLELFFQEEQEENSKLEFKSGDVGIEGIYKEICSFLNTEGGILIIGSPKETTKLLDNGVKIKICKGQLTPTQFRNRDWLMQKISSNISPPPNGIRIKDIFDKLGNYFIIEVEQSQTPPHQSGDGTYYIRLERDSKPAPHGLVEALFFKRQKAKLELQTTILMKEKLKHEISISIKNSSSFPTEKVSFSINFYNIKSLTELNSNSIPVQQNENNSIVISHTSDVVLWKGLEIVCKYNIFHKNQPFLVNMTCWSRDAEIIKNIGLYDPISNSIIESENESTPHKKGYEYYYNLLNSLINTTD